MQLIFCVCLGQGKAFRLCSAKILLTPCFTDELSWLRSEAVPFFTRYPIHCFGNLIILGLISLKDCFPDNLQLASAHLFKF